MSMFPPFLPFLRASGDKGHYGPSGGDPVPAVKMASTPLPRDGSDQPAFAATGCNNIRSAHAQDNSSEFVGCLGRKQRGGVVPGNQDTA
jgi:hypothetical protein